MTIRPKVLLTHPGTQHSYKLAKELNKRGYLFLFLTGLAITEKNIFYKLSKLISKRLSHKLKQRTIYYLPSNKLKISPFLELKALQRVRKGDRMDEVFFERNRVFQEKITNKTLLKSDIIIGFDTSSWLLAKRCKEMGKSFLLDVSIAHSLSKQKVYHELLERFPEWKFNIELKKQEFIDFEHNEYDQSKAIVVASTFTRNTLIENGVDAAKIFINPYGVDALQFKVNRKNNSSKLKFLFVGLVDARKGIPHLIKIWETFIQENIELNIVGPISEDVQNFIKKEHLPNVNIIGKVPHAELASIFNENDIFIFPTFFEGFGLVILEAMASGMPIITTTATIGPDIIENGKEGFIITPGDDMALSDAIKQYINSPALVSSMGNLARKKAELFTWDSYGDRYVEILNKVLAQR